MSILLGHASEGKRASHREADELALSTALHESEPDVETHRLYFLRDHFADFVLVDDATLSSALLCARDKLVQQELEQTFRDHWRRCPRRRHGMSPKHDNAQTLVFSSDALLGAGIQAC